MTALTNTQTMKPHCPPPTKPLPAIPISETIKKIQDILSLFFCDDIIRKILILYKGLIHPVARLVMQPKLIEYHRFHEEKRKDFFIHGQQDGYCRYIHHYRPPKETDNLPYFCFNLKYSQPDKVWKMPTGYFEKGICEGYDIYSYKWRKQWHYTYDKENHPSIFDRQKSSLTTTWNMPVITTRTAGENPWYRLLYDRRGPIRYARYPKVTIKDIKTYLKQNGIKGYSKLNKDELIELMMTF